VAHGAAVQRLQHGADRGVGLVQAEQPPVAQPGQDPALDHLHPNLDLGLVAWLADARRYHRGAVVGCHLLVAAVDSRLVAASGGDAGLEVVADQLPRGAAEEAEGVDVTADPVRQTLAPADLRIGQAGGAEHGHENLGCPHLAGRRVDHRQGLPGEIDEQLVAGQVGLAHGQRHPAAPGGVEVAEPAVAIALGLFGPVFLPKQQQGHSGSTKLRMDPRPVGRRPQCLRQRKGWAEQPRLQLSIVQPGRYRPADADHRRPAEILGDRVAADPDRGGDLPLALATGVLAAKDFSNLAHGQSLSGHGSPRQCCRIEPAPGG
jgi:hypothetical protein